MNIIFSLGWIGFIEYILIARLLALRCILCPRLSSLAWAVIAQHKLLCILSVNSHRMGLVNTCSRWHGMSKTIKSGDTFCVFAGMGGVWSTHVEKNLVSTMVLRDRFCVLAEMGGV